MRKSAAFLYSSRKSLIIDGLLIFFFFFLLSCCIPSYTYAFVQFQDVTVNAGLYNVSKGFCAAWGDYNNDGKPDLFDNNHQYKPSLYINNGDGTFTDILDQVVDYQGLYKLKDTHGCIWTDFDNDGDMDFMQSSGGNGGGGIVQSNYNEFFVNEGGILIDRATEMGVAFPADRGRSPLFFDYNHDGLLELLLTSLSYPENLYPTKFLRQADGGFEDITLETVIQFDQSCDYAQISDVYSDGDMELFVSGTSYMAVYNLNTMPITDISHQLFANPEWINKGDIHIADFNGDLLPDIYKTRGSKGAGLKIVSDNEFKFLMQVSPYSTELYLTFMTGGNVHFNVFSPWLLLSDVHIGANGFNPPAWEIDLSPGDPDVQGIKPYVTGQDRGIYIGFDLSTQTWTVILNSNNVTYAASDNLDGIISSDLPISNIQTYGFVPDAGSWTDSLFIGSTTGFKDKSAKSGIKGELPSMSSVAGDFDNDMDLDIYVVESTPISNEPNVMYENDGSGIFTRVPGAAGAEGTLQGAGWAAVTADYDGDGFLDIYFINGQGTEPLALGPDQLFHNLGNSNHWIEIDLEGTVSNRDGIGAKVYVTAGGKTQLREQNGGVHSFSQDYTRLHFGLGSRVTINTLRVEWPNGIVQTINNMPADQIIRIIEPAEAYSTCGNPQYQAGVDEGVFVWKEPLDGPYRLRIVGNGISSLYEVKILSDNAPVAVSPVGLDYVSGDTLEEWNYGLKLRATVLSSEKGVDFSLPPGAKVLLSVEKDGIANPRFLNVGPYMSHIAPSGWIMPLNNLQALPNYTMGEKMGWYMGAGSNTVNLRWTVNTNSHYQQVKFMSSDDIVLFEPYNLESYNDSYTQTANTVTINSNVGAPYYDGANYRVMSGSEIGLTYVQDGLFQPRRLNPDSILPFGFPNAFWLDLKDNDIDGDGTTDCNDLCPRDPGKTIPGICGCGVSDIDSDGDGTPDCNDLCPNDPGKTAPGICGCGLPDAGAGVDSDGDGTPDCIDICPNDPAKTIPGICGCGVSDIDSDGDGTPDCNDLCPNDPGKTAPGLCGCNLTDDADGDGYYSCINDCDDLNPAINPDTIWYPDNDGDGYGIPTGGIPQCNRPDVQNTYAVVNTDCDDNDLNIYPGSPPVRIVKTPSVYYTALQASYDAAINGDTVHVKGVVLTENINININKTVTVKSGADCSYSTFTGTTTVVGNMTITGGTLVIDDGLIELSQSM